MTPRWKKIQKRADDAAIKRYKQEANARSLAFLLRFGIPALALLWLLWLVNR